MRGGTIRGSIIVEREIGWKRVARWHEGGFCRYLEDVSFETLCDTFGEPYPPSPDGKARVQWFISFMDGDTERVAGIYDYKSSEPLEKITKWHLGGDSDACRWVDEKIFPQ